MFVLEVTIFLLVRSSYIGSNKYIKRR